MSASGYVPDRGDVVWINFDPQKGHEQAGKRPAVVLSPKSYNDKAGLAILCPVTSSIKGYPFEVRIPDDCGVSGVILADHVKSLDWKARGAEYKCRLPEQTTEEVLEKHYTLIS